MKCWLKFRSIYVILLCLLFSQVAMGQDKPVLRHVSGFQGVGLGVGASLEAPCCSLDYTYHLNRNWHLGFGLGYARGEQRAVTIDQVGLQALLAYTLWSYQSNYYTSLVAGCHFSHRWQENNRGRQQQTYLQLGILVGASLALYLTNHLVLTLFLAPQINILNTDTLGLFQLLGMLGLQYTF